MRILVFATALMMLTQCSIAQKGISIHVVDKGETLYAVSKHYAVPLGALVAANPGSELGISIGQRLSIPLDEVKKKEKRNAPDLVDGELIHQVRRKETLYGIAKRYDIDLNDLMQRNPDLADGMKDGMSIVIPVAKAQISNPAMLLEASGGAGKLHTVEAGETLYSVGRRFGVPVQAIQDVNGGLPNGLKAGSVIRIPEPPKEETDSVMKVIAADKIDPMQEYELSFMLPFEVNAEDNSHEEVESGSLAEIALHFYFGSRVALDTLQEMGLRAKVHVFDVGVEEEKVLDLLKDPSVNSTDLFIGPFHRTPLERVVAAAGAKGAHVVCPVPQNNKVLLGRPHLSNVVGGRSAQVKGIAAYIQQNFGQEKIILVKPAKWEEKDLQDQMERTLQGVFPEKEFTRAAFEKTTDEIQAALVLNGTNVLVVPSEDLAIVSDLITKLNSLPSSYKIVLFGMANWMDFDNIDPIYKEKFNLHIPAHDFVDRSDERVQAFILAFRDQHGAEPSSFAFMGYDVTLFYGKALLEQGRSFDARFAQVSAAPLHTDFDMQRTGLENGFKNDHVVILNYRDFELHPKEIW